MSLPTKSVANDQPVSITAHPPERGRQGSTVTLACGCCCCCCCCLHAIGGAIGGLTGSLLPIAARPPIEYDPSAPFPFRRDEFYDDEEQTTISPTLLYWLLVATLSSIGSLWFFVSDGTFTHPEYLLWGFLIALIGFLPLLQLGASLLSCAAVAMFYTDKRRAFIRIGKITLWSTVGALAGMGIMVGVCAGMGAISKL